MATINVNPGRNPMKGLNLSKYILPGFILLMLVMLLSNTTFVLVLVIGATFTVALLFGLAQL